MRIYPPIIAGLYLFGALVINYFFLSPRIIYSPYHFFSLLFILAGIFLTLRAARLFLEKGTTHNPYGTPSVLLTIGPFSFSRNPMYLGMALILFGAAVFVGSVFIFLAPIAFFLTINRFFIPREEKKLEQIFGQQFLNYKNRVRRWL